MKRFYCTICNRIKRVRQYPLSISNKLAEDIHARVGHCNRHDETPVQSTPKQVNLPMKSLLNQNKRRA